jgi:phage terminase large subunit-like protein
MDYVAVAQEYIAGVLSGAIPACKWVKLACRRQVEDLARAGSADFPFRFDEERAAHPCRFIEKLPHVKGKWASPKIRLEPWQIFILTTVFGWVDVKGNRRYRVAYIEVPRKNAKSTLSSGVALYMLVADGEPGAEVYSVATKRDQARITFDDARRMVERTEGIRLRFGVQAFAHAVMVDGTASKFVPLASEADSLDGLNLHCGIIDELHAHKTRAVWDVLDSATGSRTQPLVWAITTAGWNQAGICYEQRGYVTQVLQRLHADESYFGIIYTIDLPEKGPDGKEIPGDDWTQESTWKKANPNYGVSVLPDDITKLAKKAIQSAQSQNNFLTKRLNVWVTADTAFFNIEAWRKCRRDVDIEDFEGRECCLGTDLSSKVDLASKIRLFRREEPDGVQYYAFGTHYLPEEAIESGINANQAHFAGWQKEGWLELTDGAAIDLDRIEDEIREDCRRFQVCAVGYDPWNSEQMRQHLEAEGSPMIENRMGVQTMSEPMKTLEALILSGRIHHDGDPVLAWAMSNVVAKVDLKGNVYPRKERPESKIDPAVALIIALRLMILQQGEPNDGVYLSFGGGPK